MQANDSITIENICPPNTPLIRRKTNFPGGLYKDWKSLSVKQYAILFKKLEHLQIGEYVQLACISTDCPSFSKGYHMDEDYPNPFEVLDCYVVINRHETTYSFNLELLSLNRSRILSIDVDTGNNTIFIEYIRRSNSKRFIWTFDDILNCIYEFEYDKQNNISYQILHQFPFMLLRFKKTPYAPPNFRYDNQIEHFPRIPDKISPEMKLTKEEEEIFDLTADWNILN